MKEPPWFPGWVAPITCAGLCLGLAGCAIGGRPPAILYAAAEPMVEHRAGMIDEPVFGGQLYLFEAGPLEETDEVETVVLVHGLSDQGVGDWRHVVPGLARRYRVLVLDLPGFARSDKGDHHYSFERYGELLHWLIEERAVGPVTLVGHSLGGALALFHADRWPNDVSRLILVDTAGVLHRTAYLKYVASLRGTGIFSKSPDLREGLNDFIGWLLEATEKLPGTDRLGQILADRKLRRRYLRSDPSAVAGAAMTEVDFSQRLHLIEQPTLVIWGEDDDVAPVRTGQVLSARLPDVRMRILPDVGHAPMLESPEAFNRLLLATLDSWPPAEPLRLPEQVPSHRVGTCRGRDDVSFRGDYARLEIQGCDRVQVRDGSIGQVIIDNASVEFHNVRIDADQVGLQAGESSVVLTNVRVEADTALLLDNARIDMAAVELVGRRSAVRSVNDSNLVFSICRIQSPHGSGTLHGAFEFNEDSKL
ncbi:MAG: alpha/beta hydrolase [Thermoanaerobaculia bacterium]|nr:alpha/beta hydrolase [Thermoanaerobaculia bacterium]